MEINSRAVLNNGVLMPYFGLGVFRSPAGEITRSAVRTAIEYGYRMIDTARVYCNEKSVGRGIKDSGISRKDIFVTTKLWKDDFKNPRQGLLESLERLQLDYIDLYLLHWPFAGYVEAYLELEKLQKEGLIKAIGVSNFKIHHLQHLKESGASVIPQVNQVECHPENQENALLDYCRKEGILMEAYSPLGGQGRTLVNDPRIWTIADYHHVTTAQVILKWNLQRGVAIIPKSVNFERILENSQIFSFDLTPGDMDILNDININLRRAYDSDKIDQRPEESFPRLIDED